MKVTQFRQAKNLHEALNILSESSTPWRILAGGTDLLIELRSSAGNEQDPCGFLSIERIDEMRRIRQVDEELHIGANVTFTELRQSEILRQKAPILAEMARQMGSVQIRNRATLGGNLVNANPCADSAPPLLALNADVILKSISVERRLPLRDFFVSPGKTVIDSDEILTTIIIQVPKPSAKWGYLKLGRRNSAAISRMTLALVRRTTSEGIYDTYLSMGAVMPTPRRMPNVEAILNESTWDETLVERASEQARLDVQDITGIRWSSEYKLPVVENLMSRVLWEVDHPS